jgi:hypothetical protein
MTACILALFLRILPLRFAWLSDLHEGSSGAPVDSQNILVTDLDGNVMSLCGAKDE